MKKMIALASLGLLLVTSVPALAGMQQEKMSMCNKEAKEKSLAGEEHKAFMKSCLSKDGAAASGDEMTNKARAERKERRAAQKEKRMACKKESEEKSLKGEERRTFMKACMGKNADASSADKKADAAADDKKNMQQEKMTMCNKSASEKALKGPERRRFMSECLKD